MLFEVSFGYFYGGVSHGIADEFRLVVPVVGDGCPAVPRTVAAQRLDAHVQSQFLQPVVEAAQGIAVLTLSLIHI